MLKKSYVQQAIKEEAETVIRSGLAVAADVLVDLARNASSESVKLQATTALLDRVVCPSSGSANTGTLRKTIAPTRNCWNQPRHWRRNWG
ncbi:MAG: hypothetical protein ABW079_15335 [Sedimenticola sp.]